MNIPEIQAIPSSLGYEIELNSVSSRAHACWALNELPQVTRRFKTDTLVVGAGLAGLAAAYCLRHHDYHVCEVSQHIGGTSARGTFQGLEFSRGAHYEVELPAYFGREVLNLLAELAIIRPNPQRGIWEFIDAQYLVPNSRKNYVIYEDQIFYSDSVEQIPGSEQLKPLYERFYGTMTSPTTEIDPHYRWLNEISFEHFLKREGVVLNHLLREVLSDGMWDDYGANISKVSALAGIHYLLCRPDATPPVRSFSPPQGNHYFAERLYHQLDPQRILRSHAVLRIIPVKDYFRVLVLDCTRSELVEITSRSIIFGAHKHALKHIYPRDYPCFAHNHYAPWMVINSIFESPPLPQPAYWQNQLFDITPWFTSFVNLSSLAIDTDSPYRVLSSYLCLPESMRDDLLQLPRRIEYWTEFMLDYINETLQVDMKSACIKVVVTPYGHAMPIPVPGYLFNDANECRSLPNLVYAGVDNSRLPILVEAIDSGIQAAKLILAGP